MVDRAEAEEAIMIKDADLANKANDANETNEAKDADVGVYMQAMITRGLLDACLYAWMRTHTHVHMVLYGRRTDRGLKYLFVEDTGSGSVPLP